MMHAHYAVQILAKLSSCYHQTSSLNNQTAMIIYGLNNYRYSSTSQDVPKVSTITQTNQQAETCLKYSSTIQDVPKVSTITQINQQAKTSLKYVFSVRFYVHFYDRIAAYSYLYLRVRFFMTVYMYIYMIRVYAFMYV